MIEKKLLLLLITTENDHRKLFEALFSKNIFDDEFLKEIDDALKPIEFPFESYDEINDDSFIQKSEIKTRKSRTKKEMNSSNKYKSNIIIIVSDSENNSKSTFSDQMKKEIEKIEKNNK